MPPINSALYWRTFRTNYKMKYLKWKWAFNKDEKRYREFQYYEGLQQKILEQIMTTLNEQGFTKKYVIEKWRQKTGIVKKDAESYFNGKNKSLGLWELNHLLKTFDFELQIKYKGARIFTHNIENGRIIILSNKNPQFHVNMNAENPYDFSVDFYDKETDLKLVEVKAYKVFLEACNYYFLQQSKLPKLPWSKPRMREIFKLKYARGEMYVKEIAG